MKKTYLAPALQVNQTSVEQQLMAVSIYDDNADKDTEVLIKESNGDWGIWEDTED